MGHTGVGRGRSTSWKGLGLLSAPADAAEPSCIPLCPSSLPEPGLGATWRCQEMPIQELAQHAPCHQRRQEQAHRPGRGQSSQLGRSRGRLHGDNISAGPQMPGRVEEEKEGHYRWLRGRWGSGPWQKATVLSLPTAELCRAPGLLPLLSLHDTARQVTPHHYFTEEETEARRG